MATAEISASTLKLAAKRAGKLGAEGRDERLIELAEDWENTLQPLPEGRWEDIDDAVKSQLVAIRDGAVVTTRDRQPLAGRGSSQ